MKTNKLNAEKKGTAIIPVLFLSFSFLLATNMPAQAHCDTMDGPVIKDAITALSRNNPAYVLKWVQHGDEAELREAFSLAMNVRKLGTDAKTLADKYFFETLVRLHRSGEGVPYTGVKPSGTPVDERILAADLSLEEGNLNPLNGKISDDQMPELKERFERVIALRNFDINNIEAGREYVEAYVSYFKYAEGEEDHMHNAAGSAEQHDH